MRLRDMKIGVPYVVTKGTWDETLQVGDKVKMEEDGYLMCKQGGGWLTREEWQRYRCTVDLDVDMLNALSRRLQREIKEIKGVIEEHAESRTTRYFLWLGLCSSVGNR